MPNLDYEDEEVESEVQVKIDAEIFRNSENAYLLVFGEGGRENEERLFNLFLPFINFHF